MIDASTFGLQVCQGCAGLLNLETGKAKRQDIDRVIKVAKLTRVEEERDCGDGAE
jgi:hypothetical protein